MTITLRRCTVCIGYDVYTGTHDEYVRVHSAHSMRAFWLLLWPCAAAALLLAHLAAGIALAYTSDYAVNGSALYVWLGVMALEVGVCSAWVIELTRQWYALPVDVATSMWILMAASFALASSTMIGLVLCNIWDLSLAAIVTSTSVATTLNIVAILMAIYYAVRHTHDAHQQRMALYNVLAPYNPASLFGVPVPRTLGRGTFAAY